MGLILKIDFCLVSQILWIYTCFISLSPLLLLLSLPFPFAPFLFFTFLSYILVPFRFSGNQIAQMMLSPPQFIHPLTQWLNFYFVYLYYFQAL
jgi:hypothetical protein